VEKQDESDDKQNRFQDLIKKFNDILGKIGSNLQIAAFPSHRTEEVKNDGDFIDEEINGKEALTRIKKSIFGRKR
jgi:hypothetical protein